MMFRYTFARADVADRIERAVRAVLAKGLRTGDIALPGETRHRHARDGRRGGGRAVGVIANSGDSSLEQGSIMRVGFVGWRGMVGSVLMQRMLEERDFDRIEPVFFTTSNVGGKGPAIGRDTPPLESATDLAALAALDAIVTCQGGDYTNDVFPNLRAAGWNGYWIDAASALRMKDDAVIILDPVNRDVIDAALREGRQELHRRQLHGEPDDDGDGRAVPARR